MRNDNEMHFIDESNEQTIQTSNNYSPVPSDVPNDGSTASKLANAKMVRIRMSTKCSVPDVTWKKPYYQINAISTIDDNNPKNENEVPILEAEKTSRRFCSGPTEFTFYDANSKQPYSTSRYNGDIIKAKFNCCEKFGVVYSFAKKMSKNNNFVLLDGFPPKPLREYGKTITELGIENAVLTQRIN